MSKSGNIHELSERETWRARLVLCVVGGIFLLLGVSICAAAAGAMVTEGLPEGGEGGWQRFGGRALGAAVLLAIGAPIMWLGASFRRVTFDGERFTVHGIFGAPSAEWEIPQVRSLMAGGGEALGRPYASLRVKGRRWPVRFIFDPKREGWNAAEAACRVQRESPQRDAPPGREPVQLLGVVGRTAQKHPRSSVGVAALLIVVSAAWNSPWSMIAAVLVSAQVARRTPLALALLAPLGGAIAWLALGHPGWWNAPDEGVRPSQVVAGLGLAFVPVAFFRRRAAELVVSGMRSSPAPVIGIAPQAMLPVTPGIRVGAVQEADVASAAALPGAPGPTGAGADVQTTPPQPCPIRDLDADIPFDVSPRARAVAAIAEGRFRSCRRAAYLQGSLLLCAHALGVCVSGLIGGGEEAGKAFGISVVLIILSGLAYLVWRLGWGVSSIGGGGMRRFRATSMRAAWRRSVVVILWISVVASLVASVLTAAFPTEGKPAHLGWIAWWDTAACSLSLVGSALIRRRLKRHILAQAKVFPPPRLLLLRAFRPGTDYERRTEEVFDLVRRRFTLLGHCVLLGGPDWLGTNVGLGLSVKRLSDALARTPGEVDARLSSFRADPEWPRIAGEYAFPPNSVLCSGDVWTHAFESLLDQADVVLLDFRAISPENHGCARELSEVVCRVPTERFVILIDDTMDRRFLTPALDRAWAARAARPPSEDGPDARVTVCMLRPTIAPTEGWEGDPSKPSAAPPRKAPAADLLSVLDHVSMRLNLRHRQILSLLFSGVAAARVDMDFAARRKRSTLSAQD